MGYTDTLRECNWKFPAGGRSINGVYALASRSSLAVSLLRRTWWNTRQKGRREQSNWLNEAYHTVLSVKVVDVLLVERAKPGFFMVGIGTPVSLESTKNTQHELEKTRWKIPFVIGTTAFLLSRFLNKCLWNVSNRHLTVDIRFANAFATRCLLGQPVLQACDSDGDEWT